MNEEYIDFDALRSSIEDYYGTAAYCGFPAVMVSAVDAQAADEEELIEMAKEAGIDLNDYLRLI